MQDLSRIAAMMFRTISDYGFSDGGQHLLHNLGSVVASIGDFAFFTLILDYLKAQIHEFGLELMAGTITFVLSIALVLMTLWVLIQGFRIITGRSRDSMMELVMNMLRAVLIVAVATTMSMFGTDLHDFLTETVQDRISYVVTGEPNPEKQIDRSLAWMQVAMSSIDAIDTMGDAELAKEKGRAMMFVGLGTGGPAVTAGAMLMLYQIALALFIGLGPLFILCLLFDQTKALFQKWLLYGIGTMFSMAVLSAMVAIALDMVVRVAIAFWTAAAMDQFFMRGAMIDGMNSQALQQGGMGLILTTLILTAPPMAAFFFQGTLGSFMAYSQIGGSPAAAQPGPQGQPPGAYTPPAPSSAPSSAGTGDQYAGRVFSPSNVATPPPEMGGRMGAANRGQ